MVAHAQVLDARARGWRHLVERLRERRAGVPDARIPARVECTDAPVIGVVLEYHRRCVRGADHRIGATDLRAGREIDGGVDLELVPRRAGDRIPREQRIEHLRRSEHVVDPGGCARRPGPQERLHRRGRAAMPLGVNRRHAPVVRPGRQERGARRVHRAGRFSLRAHERAERRIGRDRDDVLRGPRDRRPTQHERVRGMHHDRAVRRRLKRRRRRPRLHDRARRTPRRRCAVRLQRPHAPPVGAVRDRLLERRARVARRELIFAAAEHGRVHPAVGGELELIPVGLRDGSPRERRQRVDDEAARRRDGRRRRKSSRGKRRLPCVGRRRRHGQGGNQHRNGSDPRQRPSRH